MNTTINFCTLFNSAYLSRGVLLYKSLEKHCPNFHLFVLAFDDWTYNYLSACNFSKLTVISLKEFEDEELLRIKPTRTAGEYCWTCSSASILYCIETYQLQNCTYIDADMCFYSDPTILVEEMGEKEVLITEHRYSKAYDQSEISGKYCVQFVSFKNLPEGMKVLKKWRKDCIDWCYARVDGDKFGDQKYLDNWKNESDSIHELQHLGGGLAPWNIQQYRFKQFNGKIIGKEITSNTSFETIFFHFHGLKFFTNKKVLLTGAVYEISKEIKEMFYLPYVQELLDVSKEIDAACNYAFNSNGAKEATDEKPLNYLYLLRCYLYDVRNSMKNIGGRYTRNRILHHHILEIK